jgi:hypothetical protein
MPRRDDAQDKSAQWVAQASQLKMRLKSAVKDRDTVLDTLRSDVLDKDTIEEIESEERNRARQRSEESEAVMRQLRQVKSNVSTLRQLIESRGTGADYVDKLRRAMDAAENEVYVAREAHKERMDIICSEERVISKELMDVEKLVQNWINESTRPQSAKEGARGRSAGRGASRERPDEIAIINSRVETAFQPTELPPEVRTEPIFGRSKRTELVFLFLSLAPSFPHSLASSLSPYCHLFSRSLTPFLAPLLAPSLTYLCSSGWPNSSCPFPSLARVGSAMSMARPRAQVLAVEKILREEGGVTGGWDERDHERFLRYRTQHPGQLRVYVMKTAGTERERKGGGEGKRRKGGILEEKIAFCRRLEEGLTKQFPPGPHTKGARSIQIFVCHRFHVCESFTHPHRLF